MSLVTQRRVMSVDYPFALTADLSLSEAEYPPAFAPKTARTGPRLARSLRTWQRIAGASQGPTAKLAASMGPLKTVNGGSQCSAGITTHARCAVRSAGGYKLTTLNHMPNILSLGTSSATAKRFALSATARHRRMAGVHIGSAGGSHCE